LCELLSKYQSKRLTTKNGDGSFFIESLDSTQFLEDEDCYLYTSTAVWPQTKESLKSRVKIYFSRINEFELSETRNPLSSTKSATTWDWEEPYILSLDLYGSKVAKNTTEDADGVDEEFEANPSIELGFNSKKELADVSKEVKKYLKKIGLKERKS
jgi:hypothetical protein